MKQKKAFTETKLPRATINPRYSAATVTCVTLRERFVFTPMAPGAGG